MTVVKAIVLQMMMHRLITLVLFGAYLLTHINQIWDKSKVTAYELNFMKVKGIIYIESVMRALLNEII